MTAIAGLIRFDNQPVDKAILTRMGRLLQPYGCDVQDQICFDDVGLFRALLRTTPEDTFDCQPINHLESKSLFVFDGRLDNRYELISKLGIPSHEAIDLADSSLALLCILKWGEDAVKSFVGDFSFAFWSRQDKCLLMGRDQLGNRPLFWSKRNNLFAFATLPKALFVIPGVSRELCEERLSDFLTLTPEIGPESFYKDIYRVEPGHIIKVNEFGIRSRRYYCFDTQNEVRFNNDDDYVEAFREKLNLAVSAKLRSNTFVASQLSSGFDSSTVTAVAAKQLSIEDKRLRAYTAVPEKDFSGFVPRGRHADEGPGARALVARFDNIDHFEIRSNRVSPIDNLFDNVASLNRAPLNPCNNVWFKAIYDDLARSGGRVILTGLRGNMTISYAGEEYLPFLLSSGNIKGWLKEATAFKNANSHITWKNIFLRSFGPYIPSEVLTLINRFRGKNTQLTDYTGIHPEFMARIDTVGRMKKAKWDRSYKPWANSRDMRIAILNRMDPGEYMADANYSRVEMRDPTGDIRLIEFCLAVPDSQYLRDGQSRWLLKRLMLNTLPDEILNCRTKGLQAADWYVSMVDKIPVMRQEILQMKSHSVIGGYLDLDTLLADLDNWPQNGWQDEKIIMKYRLRLLRAMAAGVFISQTVPENVK
jgi:asparagine synthase (glutamine-hydrolysing)